MTKLGYMIFCELSSLSIKKLLKKHLWYTISNQKYVLSRVFTFAWFQVTVIATSFGIIGLFSFEPFDNK